MYDLDYSGQFKRDYKLMKRRGTDLSLIHKAFDELEANGQLPPEYRPHILHGNWSGYWEAHILPNWLIIYEISDTIRLVRLVRTGTHSDLF